VRCGGGVDPGNYNCGRARLRFLRLENGVRKQYLDKDTGSEWSNAVMVTVLMREGDERSARGGEKMTANPTWMREFLSGCLNKRRPRRFTVWHNGAGRSSVGAGFGN